MDTERINPTVSERNLLDPMVRRVAELNAGVRQDDPGTQAQLIHATGRLQGRLDAVLLARGLRTDDWRLYHQNDGSWYVQRIEPHMAAPSLPGTATAPFGIPIYRAPVDKELRRRTISAASVGRDLQFLAAVLQKLIELVEEGSDDFVLRQALFSSALVAYSRTRNPDRRQDYWITDELVANCGGEKLDDFVKGVRDKHIAHSINAFEQTDLGVIVDNHQIRGTAITHVALTGWQANDLKTLRALASCLSTQVEQQLDDLQNAAETAARAMPITDIERGDPIGFEAPSPGELRTARKDG